MPDEMRSRKALIQNLRDAGCSEKVIVQYLMLDNAGDELRILESQRKCLLDALHAEQRKLECLDHLRYQLQKQIRTM